MSRKGYCWDNAVIEALFASLKKERIKKKNYRNREAATAEIIGYIAFYNHARRHNHIGGVSPEKFEVTHAN